MRVAVFSDLHGNPYACQAIIKAISREGEMDAILAAGDLCLGGSHPAACLEMLGEAGIQAVYGNTEAYLLTPDQVPPDELHRSIWDVIQPAVSWTLDQLTPDQMRWLAGLPFEQSFNPTGEPSEAMSIVHANPQDLELMVYPDEAGQSGLWGEVRQPDSAPELAKAFEKTAARWIVFGHFHYTFQRLWRDKTLVGVAPCSLPGVDHDPRARFTIFEWRENCWKFERRWVDYPVEKEIAALQASDMPSKTTFLRYFM